jgi:hypothetical protein
MLKAYSEVASCRPATDSEVASCRPATDLDTLEDESQLEAENEAA